MTSPFYYPEQHLLDEVKRIKERLERLELQQVERAQKEAYPPTAGELHPLVLDILYKDVEEIPWYVLGDQCRYDEGGLLCSEWLQSLNEEQWLRLSIAAYVQTYFNKQSDGRILD